MKREFSNWKEMKQLSLRASSRSTLRQLTHQSTNSCTRQQEDTQLTKPQISLRWLRRKRLSNPLRSSVKRLLTSKPSLWEMIQNWLLHVLSTFKLTALLVLREAIRCFGTNLSKCHAVKLKSLSRVVQSSLKMTLSSSKIWSLNYLKLRLRKEIKLNTKSHKVNLVLTNLQFYLTLSFSMT